MSNQISVMTRRSEGNEWHGELSVHFINLYEQLSLRGHLYAHTRIAQDCVVCWDSRQIDEPFMAIVVGILRNYDRNLIGLGPVGLGWNGLYWTRSDLIRFELF